MTDDESSRPTNRLARETSAYLRQHMHNPVDWHPWGPEALARAKETDRPLFVSIGYSACHWCHVMERESFEDPATAAILNESFIAVKVDREERPDVDQIYMETVTRLTGHGGWPLTVFCTPDGSPFFGGTYYPPEPRHGLPAFTALLRQVATVWAQQRDEVLASASQILGALGAAASAGAEETSAALPGRAELLAAAEALLPRLDTVHGGLGDAPKFPTPVHLELLLLALPHLGQDDAERVAAFLRTTCDAMARRGLYDHLGGGFHRYCVDARWAVPHFEKMLYDQGQLMRIYDEVARLAGGDATDLAWPVRETAAWLGREMTAGGGAFVASQDADSEGEEGRFYVWTPEQVGEVLDGDDAQAFCEAFGVTPGGNFEGGASVLADRAGPPREATAALRDRMRTARAERTPPDTDRKIVAAWNGLTISGLAHAAGWLDDPDLLERGRLAADFVLSEMRDEGGRLLRIHAEGQAKVPAFLDDHAGMLSACLDLHRAGAGDGYLQHALDLADDIAARFFDEEEGDLFLVANDGDPLPHRPRSDPDGATPHSASLAVLGLLRAASLSGRSDLRATAERVLRRYAASLRAQPLAWPTLVRAAYWAEQGLSAAVVVGDADAAETAALAGAARRLLAPEEAVVVIAHEEARPPGLDPAWVAGRTRVEGRATAYVCRGTVCSLPVTDPEQLAPLG